MIKTGKPLGNCVDGGSGVTRVSADSGMMDIVCEMVRQDSKMDRKPGWGRAWGEVALSM